MSRKRHAEFAGPGNGHTALSIVLGANNEPPTEFCIFKAGDNPSEKGLFKFTEASATSVMDEYAAHGKTLRFDFNHGTLLEGVDPEVAKSAGSFVPEIRDAGKGPELWAARCNWTAYARDKIAQREYGDFSPYFNHDDDGVVTRLINVALTNLPALDNIQPLVAASANSNDKDQDMPCEACTALTSKLSAMDEDCKVLRAKLAAYEKKDADGDADLKSKASMLTALTGKTAHGEAMSEIEGWKKNVAALTALTGAASVPAALGMIEGWKGKAEGFDKLKKESDEREADSLKTALTAVLDAGVKGGKITPAKRASFETRALSLGGGKPSKDGIEWLSGLVEDLPVLIAIEGAKPPLTSDEGVTLTTHEIEFATRNRLDQKTMLAVKVKKIADKKAKAAGAQA